MDYICVYGDHLAELLTQLPIASSKVCYLEDEDSLLFVFSEIGQKEDMQSRCAFYGRSGVVVTGKDNKLAGLVIQNVSDVFVGDTAKELDRLASKGAESLLCELCDNVETLALDITDAMLARDAGALRF